MVFSLFPPLFLYNVAYGAGECATVRFPAPHPVHTPAVRFTPRSGCSAMPLRGNVQWPVR